MPQFTDPFVGNVPRKMTFTELVRAIRINIAAELDATSLYEAHADATDHPLAKKVLIDIANEERVHVGEFTQLLKILLADEEAWLEAGFAEVNEKAAEVARVDHEVEGPEEKAAESGVSLGDGDRPTEVYVQTIGSLKE